MELPLDRADPCVDATASREIDHLLGLVKGDHLHPGCSYSRGEVAGAAAKLDHALRLELEEGVERDVIRRRSSTARPERPAGGEARGVGVLLPDKVRMILLTIVVL